MYKFEGVSRFKFMANMDTLDKRFEFVQQLLRVLASSIN
jgi:hypothetical protein